MRNTKWTDGWHETDNFKYYIENGCFIRGVAGKDLNQKPVYPYVRCKTGGLDLDQTLKANKRNFEKISWR